MIINIERKTIVKVLLIMVAAFVVLFFGNEFFSNYLVRANMETFNVPGKGSRVLVISPHNDDEVLGSGELIKKVIKNGGEVKVVFITNGDGFKNAIQFDYLDLNPKPEDYINFGYTRQKESITALKMLGVPRQDIIFLGYPDGGISYLWSTNWDKDKPYTSSYTGKSKSPYYNSYTKGAVYCGESVANDLKSIIEDYKPTQVVFPHPNDRHPDHWAANAFVNYVLTSIDYRPEGEWLYLVHRGDWPTPLKKNMSRYLSPPAKLVNVGTKWYALDLDTDDIDEKANTISLYKTQSRTLKPLLDGFIRKNELFGEYKNVEILKNKKNDNEITVDRENRVIIDTLQDAIQLKIGKDADISNLYAEISKQNNLHIMLQTDDDISSITKYKINMIFFGDKISRLNLQVKGGTLTNTNISSKSINDINGIKVEVNKDIIHIIIPHDITGDFKNLFINGETAIEDSRLDKTAYRMLNNTK